MYKNAGHLRKPTVFLFTEAEIKDEVCTDRMTNTPPRGNPLPVSRLRGFKSVGGSYSLRCILAFAQKTRRVAAVGTFVMYVQSVGKNNELPMYVLYAF